jgi:hypothetical protein
MSFLVASGGQQLFIQSDVTGLHHLFVRNPGWHSVFDMDGPKAEATRRAFFDRVIAEKGMIAGYHFGSRMSAPFRRMVTATPSRRLRPDAECVQHRLEGAGLRRLLGISRQSG